MNQNYFTSNVGGNVNVQLSGKTGEKRYVFVDLDYVPHVYAPYGGVIQNPFPFGGKAFQGDIVEQNLNGKIYLLKTFTVLDAVGATDTAIYLKRDPFLHQPFVGDILMKAPSTITTTGTGVKITAVEATTTTVSSKTVDCWKLTITANAFGTLAADDILVEVDKEGSGAKMLVQNPNGFLEQDIQFNFTASEAATYSIAPILAGVIWRARANAIPSCVNTKANSVKFSEWFGFNFI